MDPRFTASPLGLSTFYLALEIYKLLPCRTFLFRPKNRDSAPPSLQIEEPEWEKCRSANLSEFIDVYSDEVELL